MDKRPTVVVAHMPGAITEFFEWPPGSVETIDLDMTILFQGVTAEEVREWAIVAMTKVVDLPRSPVRSKVEQYVQGVLDTYHEDEYLSNAHFANVIADAQERTALSRSLLGE